VKKSLRAGTELSEATAPSAGRSRCPKARSRTARKPRSRTASSKSRCKPRPTRWIRDARSISS